MTVSTFAVIKPTVNNFHDNTGGGGGVLVGRESTRPWARAATIAAFAGNENRREKYAKTMREFYGISFGKGRLRMLRARGGVFRAARRCYFTAGETDFRDPSELAGGGTFCAVGSTIIIIIVCRGAGATPAAYCASARAPVPAVVPAKRGV